MAPLKPGKYWYDTFGLPEGVTAEVVTMQDGSPGVRFCFTTLAQAEQLASRANAWGSSLSSANEAARAQGSTEEPPDVGAFRMTFDGGTIAQVRTNELCHVVNLRKEPYDVYIGSAGQGHDGYFENPYSIACFPASDAAAYSARSGALEFYAAYFNERIESDPEFKRRVLELRGKRLGCFCKPKPCHGDIIAVYVNAQDAP